MKRTPSAEVYALERECLTQYEALSAQGRIDLLYGDESRVSLQPCVPYGWQFTDERVAMPSGQGGGVNCLALVSRDGGCQSPLTEGRVTAEWVSERLDAFSLSLRRLTVGVLDNARIHPKAARTKAARERAAVWQERGLFVADCLSGSCQPTRRISTSPRCCGASSSTIRIKYEWLRPEDYADEDTLRYAVWTALKAAGGSLKIAFSPFKDSLT